MLRNTEEDARDVMLFTGHHTKQVKYVQNALFQQTKGKRKSLLWYVQDVIKYILDGQVPSQAIWVEYAQNVGLEQPIS